MSHACMSANAGGWFSCISRCKAGQGLHGHKTREARLDAAREAKIPKCLFILSWNKEEGFFQDRGERMGRRAEWRFRRLP